MWRALGKNATQSPDQWRSLITQRTKHFTWAFLYRHIFTLKLDSQHKTTNFIAKHIMQLRKILHNILRCVHTRKIGDYETCLLFFYDWNTLPPVQEGSGSQSFLFWGTGYHIILSASNAQLFQPDFLPQHWNCTEHLQNSWLLFINMCIKKTPDSSNRIWHYFKKI